MYSNTDSVYNAVQGNTRDTYGNEALPSAADMYVQSPVRGFFRPDLRSARFLLHTANSKRQDISRTVTPSRVDKNRYFLNNILSMRWF